MPQLNLTWWALNFILSWLSLIIVFTILLNSNLNNNTINPSTTTPNNQSSLWTWN
uniref:ATP synthase complex subunit 8 n=1 Tax=Nepanthia sp. M04 TaxID=2779942 RepID=A0A7S8CUK6_9ECHI|nr:ATP synthase F0 subunit 8 [Nepanthia sp. M04]